MQPDVQNMYVSINLKCLFVRLFAKNIMMYIHDIFVLSISLFFAHTCQAGNFICIFVHLLFYICQTIDYGFQVGN